MLHCLTPEGVDASRDESRRFWNAELPTTRTQGLFSLFHEPPSIGARSEHDHYTQDGDTCQAPFRRKVQDTHRR